ncbi:MAG: DUF1002 domain-containing protein [Eubacteriales bacterium]|nr:DUF1002 domain-containing protein [Eubacteriales bacterium]
MKIKKLCVLIMTGVLTCTAPAAVYAQDSSVEILLDNQIDSLLEDPDKAVDIIMYVKEFIDQQDVSDEEILDIIGMAEDNFQISLSDSEKESLLNIVKKFKDMDIDEEELRSQINQVYDKMDELGIGKEEVKGIVAKLIDLVKGIL